MSDPMDGYVYLSPEEEKEAQQWWRDHSHEIPDMDEGRQIAGSPIVYGMAEDPRTGRLTIPRGEAAECDDYTQAFRRLTRRQQVILELHINGHSQREIARRLGAAQPNICASLAAAKAKLRRTLNKLRSQRRYGRAESLVA